MMRLLPTLLSLLAWLAPLPGVEALAPGLYRARIAAFAGALTAGDQARATALAQELAAVQVGWPAGVLPGDPTLLVLVRSGELVKAGVRAAALAATVDELISGPPAATAQPADAAALAALAARAARAALARGGEVGSVTLDPDKLPPGFLERLKRALTWLRDRFVDLLDWIGSWFEDRQSAAGGGRSGVSVVTFMVVGALVALATVLALVAWRRRAPPTPLASAALQPAQADADPRSRAADEWVAFAQELARQGRYREAIRAWYHALLVECWSFGLIHHRVGRTNWEYALAISSERSWRGGFHELTRAFDHAWYGGRDDGEAARAFADAAQGLLARLRAPGPRS